MTDTKPDFTFVTMNGTTRSAHFVSFPETYVPPSLNPISSSILRNIPKRPLVKLNDGSPVATRIQELKPPKLRRQRRLVPEHLQPVVPGQWNPLGAYRISEMWKMRRSTLKEEQLEEKLKLDAVYTSLSYAPTKPKVDTREYFSKYDLTDDTYFGLSTGYTPVVPTEKKVDVTHAKVERNFATFWSENHARLSASKSEVRKFWNANSRKKDRESRCIVRFDKLQKERADWAYSAEERAALRERDVAKSARKNYSLLGLAKVPRQRVVYIPQGAAPSRARRGDSLEEEEDSRYTVGSNEMFDSVSHTGPQSILGEVADSVTDAALEAPKIVFRTLDSVVSALQEVLNPYLSPQFKVRWDEWFRFEDIVILAGVFDVTSNSVRIGLIGAFLRTPMAAYLLKGGLWRSEDTRRLISIVTDYESDEESEFDQSPTGRPGPASYVSEYEAEVPGFLNAQEKVKILKQIRKSRGVSLMTQCLATIAGRGIFGDTPLAKLFDSSSRMYIMEKAEKVNDLDMVTTIIDLVTYWIDRVELAANTKDWTKLFEKSFDDEMFEKLDAMYLELQNVRSKPRTDIHELLGRAVALVMRAATSKNHIVRTRTSEVDDLVCTLRATLKTTRDPPLGVIMTGPPGVGKTKFVEDFERFIKHKKGIPQDVNVTHYTTETKFQVLPAMVMIYFENDAFSTLDDNCNTPQLAKYQQMVDSAAFAPDTASIEEKKNARIAPHYIFSTTNNKYFTFSQSGTGANKLDRRYWIVRTYINLRWCQARDFAGLAGLTEDELAELGEADLEKVRLELIDWAESHPWDPHCILYEIGKMSNNENSNVANFSIRKGSRHLTRDELFAFLYMERERKLKTANVASCPTCTFPLTGCVCRINTVPPEVDPEEENNEEGPHMIGADLDDAAFRGIVPDLAFEGNIHVNHHADISFADEIVRMNRQLGLDKWLQAMRIGTTAALYLGVFVLSATVGRNIYRTFASWWKKEKSVPSPDLTPDVGYPTVAQGAVSSISNVEKQTIKVRPLTTAALPWTNKLPHVVVVRIQRSGCELWAMPVKQNLWVVPYHFFHIVAGEYNIIPEGTPITIKLGDASITQPFRQEDMFCFKDMDIAFFRLPGVTGISSYVYNKLPLEARIPLGPCRVGPYEVPKVEMFQKCLLAYAAPTIAGDCGLPVMDQAGNVYGFHIGKSHTAGVGLATFLHRGYVDEAVKALGKDMTFELQGESICFDYEALKISDELYAGGLGQGFSDHVGCLVSTDHIPAGHQAGYKPPKVVVGTTEMFATLGHNLPPMTAPYHHKCRPIADGTWKSPGVYRLLSGELNKSSDPRLIRKAFAAYLRNIPSPSSPLEPLDLYRALAGDPDNVLMNPSDTSKSVGATLKSLGVTKANLFTKDGTGSYNVHPTFLKHVGHLLAELRGDGPLPLHLVTATLKEEVYPKEKVDLHKGRLFYVLDKGVNTVGRMYMLPLNSYLMEIFDKSKLMVTLNAGSSQWAELFGKLSRHGKHRVFAADQKEYDNRHAILLPYLTKFYYHLAIKCGYSEEDARVCERIMAMACRYLLLMEGDLFLCASRLCSGRWDTIIANGIMGCVMMLYAYLRSAQDRGIPDDKLDFFGEVEAFFTGDDNVTGVKEGSHFIPSDFQNYCAELGYVITRADKKPGPVEFESIFDIDYLQRKFVERDGRVWGPLNKKSIYKSLCYFSGKFNEAEYNERMRGAILCAQREAFLHGEDFFNQVVQETSGYTYSPPPLSFKSLLREYEDDEFTMWAVEPFRHTTVVDLKPHLKPFGVGGLVAGTPLVVDHQGSGGPKEASTGCNVGNMFPSPTHLGLDSLVGPSKTRATEITNKTNNQPEVTGLNDQGITVNMEDSAPVLHTGVNELVAAPKPPPGRMSMRDTDPEVSIASFLARKRLVYSAVATDEYALPILSTWLLQPEVFKFLSHWELFRGDMVVTIMVTGSAQVMGLNRYSFYPQAEAGIYDWDIAVPFSFDPSGDNFTTYSQMPHLDMDISSVGTYEMRLPFPHPVDYVNASIGNDYVMLATMVNEPKSITGGTPTPISFDVFVHYENIVLDKIIPQAGPAESGQVSNLLEYGSVISSRLPFSFATPISKVLSAAGSIAAYMGFSRLPLEALKAVVVRFSQNTAVTGGQPNFSPTLAMDVAVSKNVDTPIPLAMDGETRINSLACRWAQVIRDLPHTAGVYNSFIVEPNVYALKAATTTRMITPLGMITNAFQYCNGPIKICVQVVGSPLVRWRFGVVICPPGISAPASFPSEGYLTTVVEVVGSTCTDIEIPYLYAEPWREFLMFDVQGVAVGRTRVRIFSLTTPTGPAATAVYPEINIWIAGTEKTGFGVPNLSKIADFRYESGVGPASESHFGEVIDDIHLLMHRPSLWGAGNGYNDLWSNTFAYPVMPVPPPRPAVFNFTDHLQNEEFWFTYVTYFAPAFLGNIGSIDWRFSPISNDPVSFYSIYNDVAIPGQPAFLLENSGGNRYFRNSSRGMQRQVLRNNPWLEVRIPDRNNWSFRQPSMARATTARSLECFAWTQTENKNTDTEQTFEMWVSTGDDFRLGGFLCAPPLVPK